MALPRLRAALALLATLAVATSSRAAAAPGAASLVEREFAAAIKKVTPATVVCIAQGAEPLPPWAEASSGVIVTKDGYVLSDIEASNTFKDKVRSFVEFVDVRVPDLKKGTFSVHPAKVVRRDEALDTTLLKIVKPPPGGFPFVVPGTADDLRVGTITFITGNSFGSGNEGTPALTAGVVASLVRAPEGDPAGKNLEVYTSAATNPGVNGGPLVDVEGRLLGIVSTWIEPSGHPKSPFQLLSKVFPVDRLRAFYADVPGASAIFPDAKSTATAKSAKSTSLGTALGDVAADAGTRVVSLSVERSEELKVTLRVPTERGPEEVPLHRYQGPVSGVLVSGDGWIVTSLYSLADTVGLSSTGMPNRIVETLGKIVSVTAHLPSGKSAPASVVAHDQRLGIALLKAETGEPETSELWVPAPAESFQVGRLVLCLGNPFGDARTPEPLLTMGIVSRVHPPDADESWRGNVQTDAAATDANCGGALVDIQGRLLGIATIWNPALHGRSSGIAFGIPWDQVRAALPSLKEGKSVRYGNAFLGIGFEPGSEDGRIGTLTAGGPAQKAGFLVGDRVAAVGGVPTPRSGDVIEQIRLRETGDRIRVTVDRGGKTLEIEVVLGARESKDK